MSKTPDHSRGSSERPYADANDEDLERLLDEAFQFRDWQTVEFIQDEFRARTTNFPAGESREAPVSSRTGPHEGRRPPGPRADARRETIPEEKK